jgi:Tfp pilus assembly PilM family ATPase
VLRLHGMAHSVINGAGLTVSTDAESLPELAGEIIDEAQRLLQNYKDGTAVHGCSSS